MNELTFCGDVWLGPNSKDRMGWLRPGLVINLEGPVTTYVAPQPSKICLSMVPAEFETSVAPHTAAACLANNHIMDHGLQGFQDTVAFLRKNRIPFYGAGTAQDNCNNPLILGVDGAKVALLGYVCASTHPIFAEADQPGVAELTLERVKADLAIARAAGATKLVVSIHWGMEEVSLPKPADIEIARSLMAMGVDLVIGHHPHCIQPILQSAQQHIFFSVGNAIFPDFEYTALGSQRPLAWAKQRWWNDTGLLVTFSPTKGVSWKTFAQRRLQQQILKLLPIRPKVWSKLPDQDTDYAGQYHGAVRRSYWRSAVSRLIARPRFPSLRSIRSVLTQVLAVRESK